MAAKCSIAPAVVWNWVIEALASSEQVDISTLTGLVKRAPAILGDAGKNTRETVSLRILENFFDHANEATVVAKTSKISFDSSERCEDVLKKILHETPEQMTKLEKEKWDVGSFLKIKRSSLLKCVLKKLKETIIDDSNPLLASLKEKSKLVVSEDGSPLNPINDKKEFQENVLQDDNIPQDTSLEGHNKRVSVENVENLEFIVKANNERANDDDDDDDDHDHERTDVAAEKEAFLMSQCMISQDSLTLTEWSQIDCCMKCNGSGELLHCTSASCELRFHESCLGSAVTLDENGEFFCPFCAYSRAISKYQEAKRNASLARKNLQAFTKFTVKLRPNKSSTIQSALEENEDRQISTNNINCMSNEKDSTQPDPITPDVNGSDQPDPIIPDVNDSDQPDPIIPDVNYSAQPDPIISDVNDSDQPDPIIPDVNYSAQPDPIIPDDNDSDQPDPIIPDVVKDSDQPDPIIPDVVKDSDQPEPIIPDVNDSAQPDPLIPDVNDFAQPDPIIPDVVKDSAQPDPMIPDVNDDDPLLEQTTELPQNPIPEQTTPKQKCKEKESQRSVESSLTRRLRKRKAKHTPPPPVLFLRRKKLPWTKPEEETLKEGVERYSSGINKKIPWKEILDFGHKVFHKGRTAIDLKDKWRNMCK